MLLNQMITMGHHVSVICKDYISFAGTEMENICKKHGIQIYDNNAVYEALNARTFPHFDFAISNNYGRLIKKPLIDWMGGNIINLHGAVLPKYKGAFTYNWGLFNLETEWGVTAHYINEKFDEGDIISISKFSIDPQSISVSELEQKTQETAYYLTLDILHKVRNETYLDRYPQRGEGHYYSRNDFEELKRIKVTDSSEIIERKIHSCWCPPYEGAYLEVGNVRYYLLNTCMMESIKK